MIPTLSSSDESINTKGSILVVKGKRPKRRRQRSPVNLRNNGSDRVHDSSSSSNDSDDSEVPAEILGETVEGLSKPREFGLFPSFKTLLDPTRRKSDVSPSLLHQEAPGPHEANCSRSGLSSENASLKIRKAADKNNEGHSGNPKSTVDGTNPSHISHTPAGATVTPSVLTLNLNREDEIEAAKKRREALDNKIKRLKGTSLDSHQWSGEWSARAGNSDQPSAISSVPPIPPSVPSKMPPAVPQSAAPKGPAVPSNVPPSVPPTVASKVTTAPPPTVAKGPAVPSNVPPSVPPTVAPKVTTVPPPKVAKGPAVASNVPLVVAPPVAPKVPSAPPPTVSKVPSAPPPTAPKVPSAPPPTVPKVPAVPSSVPPAVAPPVAPKVTTAPPPTVAKGPAVASNVSPSVPPLAVPKKSTVPLPVARKSPRVSSNMPPSVASKVPTVPSNVPSDVPPPAAPKKVSAFPVPVARKSPRVSSNMPPSVAPKVPTVPSNVASQSSKAQHLRPKMGTNPSNAKPVESKDDESQLTATTAATSATVSITEDTAASMSTFATEVSQDNEDDTVQNTLLSQSEEESKTGPKKPRKFRKKNSCLIVGPAESDFDDNVTISSDNESHEMTIQEIEEQSELRRKLNFIHRHENYARRNSESSIGFPKRGIRQGTPGGQQYRFLRESLSSAQFSPRDAKSDMAGHTDNFKTEYKNSIQFSPRDAKSDMTGHSDNFKREYKNSIQFSVRGVRSGIPGQHDDLEEELASFRGYQDQFERESEWNAIRRKNENFQRDSEWLYESDHYLYIDKDKYFKNEAPSAKKRRYNAIFQRASRLSVRSSARVHPAKKKRIPRNEFALKFLHQVLPIYRTMLVLGRFPYIIDRPKNKKSTPRFKFDRRNWRYILFIGTAILTLLLALIMVRNLIFIAKAVEPYTIYETIIRLEQNKYWVEAYLEVLNMIFVAFSSVFLLESSGGIFMADFLERWLYALSVIRYDVTQSIRKVIIVFFVFYIIYAVTFIILFFAGGEHVPTVRGMCGFVGILVFEKFLKEIRLKPFYRVVELFGLLIHLYHMLAGCLITMFIAVHCIALNNAAKRFNHRLAGCLRGAGFKKYEAVYSEYLTPIEYRRPFRDVTPYSRLFAEYIVVTTFPRQLGKVCTFPIIFYLFIKMAEVILTLFAIGEPVVNGFAESEETYFNVSSLQYLNPSKIIPIFITEQAHIYYMKSIIYAFIAIVPWMLFMEIMCKPGTSIMKGAGLVVRKCYLNCRTQRALRFLASLKFSFGNRVVLGLNPGVEMTRTLIAQFIPAMTQSGSHVLCDRLGGCVQFQFPAKLRSHGAFEKSVDSEVLKDTIQKPPPLRRETIKLKPTPTKKIIITRPPIFDFEVSDRPCDNQGLLAHQPETFSYKCSLGSHSVYIPTYFVKSEDNKFLQVRPYPGKAVSQEYFINSSRKLNSSILSRHPCNKKLEVSEFKEKGLLFDCYGKGFKQSEIELDECGNPRIATPDWNRKRRLPIVRAVRFKSNETFCCYIYQGMLQDQGEQCNLLSTEVGTHGCIRKYEASLRESLDNVTTSLWDYTEPDMQQLWTRCFCQEFEDLPRDNSACDTILKLMGISITTVATTTTTTTTQKSKESEVVKNPLVVIRPRNKTKS